ncbi:hypothetical protein DOY81_003586, partial [Sarcophaga bullata]
MRNLILMGNFKGLRTKIQVAEII